MNMAQHQPRPTALDSYDLEEVQAPLGARKAMIKATRITIHGQNVHLRALEPTVRVGDVEVLYPRIQPDERTIVGYLTATPAEGARIQLQYRGEDPIHVAEPFTSKKLKRR
jgi:hypothetical protein